MTDGIDMTKYLLRNEKWLGKDGTADGNGHHKTDGILTDDEVNVFFTSGHLNNEEEDTFISEEEFTNWYNANKDAISSFLSEEYGMDYSSSKVAVYEALQDLAINYLGDYKNKVHENGTNNFTDGNFTFTASNGEKEQANIQNLNFDKYIQTVNADGSESVYSFENGKITEEFVFYSNNNIVHYEYDEQGNKYETELEPPPQTGNVNYPNGNALETPASEDVVTEPSPKDVYNIKNPTKDTIINIALDKDLTNEEKLDLYMQIDPNRLQDFVDEINTSLPQYKDIVSYTYSSVLTEAVNSGNVNKIIDLYKILDTDFGKKFVCNVFGEKNVSSSLVQTYCTIARLYPSDKKRYFEQMENSGASYLNISRIADLIQQNYSKEPETNLLRMFANALHCEPKIEDSDKTTALHWYIDKQFDDDEARNAILEEILKDENLTNAQKYYLMKEYCFNPDDLPESCIINGYDINEYIYDIVGKFRFRGERDWDELIKYNEDYIDEFLSVLSGM